MFKNPMNDWRSNNYGDKNVTGIDINKKRNQDTNE